MGSWLSAAAERHLKKAAIGFSFEDVEEKVQCVTALWKSCTFAWREDVQGHVGDD